VKFQKRSLGDLFNFLNGRSIKPGGEGEIPVYGSNGIIGGCAEALYEDCTVIGRVGAYCGSAAYCATPFWASDNTIVAQANPDMILSRFGYFLLKSMDLNKWRGGAAQPLLTHTVLRSLSSTIPALPAQGKILQVLSAYDDLIENNTKRIKILEEMARSLYREWFVSFRFPGHEKAKFTTSKLGKIPEGWGLRPLRECAQFLSGGTPSKANADYWEGDIPWVSSGELTAFRLHRTQLHISQAGAEAGSRMVPPGTILAVVRGMSLAKEFRIGITAREMAFNQDLKAIVSAPDLDSLVLFHALDARRDEIRDRSTEAAHGTKKLDSAVLEQLMIPLPPRSVQEAFKKHVGPIHAQWDCLDKKNHTLRPTRDLLLPRLISGEIDVSSLRLETAAS
jgi:type I restriction enzyme S subunit